MIGAPANEAQAIIWLSKWADAHLCFPNVHWGLSEIDLAVVTKRSRLLWEVEVKLTLADWRADEHKAKWARLNMRRTVARMYYAVPRDLLEHCPPFVPPETGLIALWDGRASEVRAAKSVRGTPRVTDAQLLHLMESTHWRFWRERRHRHWQARIRQERRAA